MAKTYDTYKDSGIAWIGNIPSEWNLERLQSLTKEINEKNNPIKTDYVLSLTIKDGVIPYEQKGDVGNKSKDNHEEYKLAYPNTIVLNSMNILIGAVGICNYFGCVSPVYYVFKNNERSNLHFINYILSSTPFQKYLRKYANGILEIRLRISSNDIIKRYIPTPPLNEQQAIATYLDKKCGEINSLISLQEEMISELQAYKQSIITEAVTKGLDPNVPMKDSGAEWIGMIPEGWNICKLKFLCSSIKDGSHFSPTTTEEGFPYITAADVHGKGLDYANAKKISEKDYNDLVQSGCKAEKDDILLVKDGATTGRVGMKIENNPCVLLSSVAMLRVNTKSYPTYLMYMVSSNLLQQQISIAMAGSAMPRITLTKLNTFIALEVPLSEQQAIASYLDEKISQIDSLIALKQEKITELKDYKKSIIYEYVTGKKKV